MKVIFLDYGYSKSQTPERIAEKLQIILKANDIELLRNPCETPRGEYLVIRWGTDRSIQFDERAKAILNQGGIINENLNKRNAHQKMIASNVNTPILWTSWQEAKAKAKELKCKILRRKLHHTQGKDILCLKPTDFLPRNKRSGYYTQLLNKDAEFRFHMMSGKCIGLAQKKPEANANPLIWNHENGWVFEYISKEDREDTPHFEAMVTQANLAMKALGLDFGAVDLIMVKSKPYILEVNTAPSLYDTGRYAKAMINWISRTTGQRLTIPEEV